MSEDWYKNTYKNLIDSRKYRGLNKKNLSGYYEKHHIIPKCLGGTNKSDNLVLLTFREHVLAHQLLLKIYPDNKSLMKSVTRMLTCSIDDCGKKISKRIKSSREAEYLRELYSRSLSGDGHPFYGKVGPRIGAKLSDETKEKISVANKGKLTGEKNPMYGIRLTGEKNPMYGKYGGNHPASKRVIDSEGNIFECLNDCAKYHNHYRQTISKWIKNKPEKGFRYL